MHIWYKYAKCKDHCNVIMGWKKICWYLLPVTVSQYCTTIKPLLRCEYITVFLQLRGRYILEYVIDHMTDALQ